VIELLLTDTGGIFHSIGLGEGGVVSTAGPVTSILSRFGAPFDVSDVSLMVLLPAIRVTFVELTAHVVHAPVPGKLKLEMTTTPLTEIDTGLSVVVPLAYRIAIVCEPATAAVTVHSTQLPETLLVFTYDTPVYPELVVSVTARYQV